MGRGWRTRVQDELTKLPSRALLSCSRQSGIEAICEALNGRELPLVSVWVSQTPVTEGALVAALKASIARSLGPSLTIDATSLAQMNAVLCEYQRYVGPIRLIIGWAGALGPFVTALTSRLDSRSELIVVHDEAEPPIEFEGLTACELPSLKLTLEEATFEAGNRLSQAELAKVLAACDGSYLGLQAALFGLAAPSSGAALEQHGANSLLPAQIVDGFVNRAMWTAAFDWSCMWTPDRLPAIIGQAGNALFNQGEHAYLLGRLSGVPSEIKNHPELAFWRFAAASAVGQQWLLMPRVRQILLQAEAPQLRATVAMAHPGLDMLSETSRAIAGAETPVTLRAHGFALGMQGERDMPLVMFREAMRLAEFEGAHHLVIACGIDIAQLEIRRGRYHEAANWARWAVSEMVRRKVRDHTRRLSAVATLAYVTLLIGDAAEARAILDGVEAGAELINVPGLEALVSTMGDVDLVTGDLGRSESMYQMHFEAAPMEVSAVTALDLVALRLAQNDLDQAEMIADRAYVISRGGSVQERALGQLLRGMVWARKLDENAATELRAALDALLQEGTAVHIAQAACWAAICKFESNDHVAATKILSDYATYLDPLSDSGWQLLSANHPRLAELRAVNAKSRATIGLQFLGGQHLQTQSGQVQLSKRNSEIIALLAANPEGLSAERLHAYQHGDEGDASRTKVAVSRLRKVLPISSSPYRIDLPFRADFVELLDCLASGDFQAALNLYRGVLLPGSDAPAIIDLRQFIEESLKQAILASNDSDALIQLGTTLDADLEVWLSARASLPPTDYRQSAITARIRRIRANWSD